MKYPVKQYLDDIVLLAQYGYTYDQKLDGRRKVNMRKVKQAAQLVRVTKVPNNAKR